ncbi:hypothetical protein D3C72_1730340 [compost metagenome]
MRQLHEVRLRAARIGGVVVPVDKLAGQRFAAAFVHQPDPAIDGVAAMQAQHALQLRLEPAGIVEEPRIVLLQKGCPVFARRMHFDAWTLMHGVKQRGGNLHRADLAAFRFDEHGPAGIEFTQAGRQQGVEALLRRLLRVG